MLASSKARSGVSFLAALGVLAGMSCTVPDLVAAKRERICSGTQALGTAPYVGTSLAPKQLALTFDDGPGSRTAELSTYLKSRGIRAGFFVNGKNVVGQAGILAKLAADGHIVANHTEDHADLTDRALFPANAAGDLALIDELAATDALIAPFAANGRLLFRAPYGAFDAHDYAVLQMSPMSKYVGHVGWDIGGTRTATAAADWACWQNAPLLTSKACGDLYVAEIQQVGRGIVLMHDADYGATWNHVLTNGVGNTVDMIAYVVPILEAMGFTFARVDEVPDIAAEWPPLTGTDAGANASADAGAGVDAGSGSAAGPSAGADAGAGARDSGGARTDTAGPAAADPCVSGMKD